MGGGESLTIEHATHINTAPYSVHQNTNIFCKKLHSWHKANLVFCMQKVLMSQNQML